MRFILPRDPGSLARYLPEFIGLVGQGRWLRRTDQLTEEMQRSPYLYKVGLDYHWLELCACHQWKFFELKGQLDLGLFAPLDLAAVNFAATTVEVYRQLTQKGRQVLVGRMLDALKAETGFAALYLELSLTQRLIACGYDVELPDIDGTAQFDLLVRGDGLCAEIECKSQSADAGRQIHRKDFYRFMDLLAPRGWLSENRHHAAIYLVTLPSRLRPNVSDQANLLNALRPMFDADGPTEVQEERFSIRRIGLDQVDGLRETFSNERQLHRVLQDVYGQNIHAASVGGTDGASLLVMRSEKEDDPSAPTLEAMRKAASQLSRARPGFIAIQEHGLDVPELFIANVQRRMAILSNAVFHHYKAHHVNAVYVTGYGAVGEIEGRLRTPGFTVNNLKASPRVGRDAASALMTALSTEPGAPLTCSPAESSSAS